MVEFLKGAVLSVVVNVLTVLGWYSLGPWPTSIANVLLALLIIGIFGLEDKWAFPIGYWTVEVLSITLWMMGVGALLQLVG